MGCLRISLFAVVFAVGTPSMAQTQSSIGHPKVAIDVVELEGALLPKPVQEQLVTLIGLDPKTETILRARLPKDSIVNPKLIRDFYQEYKSSLPVGASPETTLWKRDRQRAVVDITFDFSTPASKSVHD
jgi:hypothetical protein